MKVLTLPYNKLLLRKAVKIMPKVYERRHISKLDGIFLLVFVNIYNKIKVVSG